MNRRRCGHSACWQLEGWDTFAHDPYPIPGCYPDQASAEQAAKARMAELAKDRHLTHGPPPEGLEDLVFIIRPDGSRYSLSD